MIKLRKFLWLAPMILVASPIGLAGCGRGTGGSSGALTRVTATPPQTAMWIIALTLEGERLMSSIALSGKLNSSPQALKGTCSNGGSVSTSGSLGSISLVASNCIEGSIEAGNTANGSLDLSWNANYSSGSCLGINYPTNLTSQFGFTNWSVFTGTLANPTELMSGNGGVTLAESTPTCSASSFTVPFTVGVSSLSPLTTHFFVTSSILSTSFDDTISTFSGTVTGTYNSSSQLTNINYSFSGTFTLPNSPGTYSFSSSSTDPFVIDYAISSAFSSGALTVTGPNETDVLTITASDQVTVTTTINGVSKTTSETLASFLGAS